MEDLVFRGGHGDSTEEEGHRRKDVASMKMNPVALW
jgi:hypothetical protein